MDAVVRCLTDDGAVACGDWQDSGGALFARRAAERR